MGERSKELIFCSLWNNKYYWICFPSAPLTVATTVGRSLMTPCVLVVVLVRGRRGGPIIIILVAEAKRRPCGIVRSQNLIFFIKR